MRQALTRTPLLTRQWGFLLPKPLDAYAHDVGRRT